MLDMLATTRVLTEAGFDARQAQAITAVVQQAPADRDDYVTREYLDERLDQLEQRFNERLDERDKRFNERLDERDKRFDERLDERDKRFDERLDAALAKSEVRIIRWMFAAVGLAVAILRLLEQ